jgi:hypothetical protein
LTPELDGFLNGEFHLLAARNHLAQMQIERRLDVTDFTPSPAASRTSTFFLSTCVMLGLEDLVAAVEELHSLAGAAYAERARRGWRRLRTVRFLLWAIHVLRDDKCGVCALNIRS